MELRLYRKPQAHEEELGFNVVDRCVHFRKVPQHSLPTSHRTFSPYFCVIGGTIPFKRRYSTSCP